MLLGQILEARLQGTGTAAIIDAPTAQRMGRLLKDM